MQHGTAVAAALDSVVQNFNDVVAFLPGVPESVKAAVQKSADALEKTTVDFAAKTKQAALDAADGLVAMATAASKIADTSQQISTSTPDAAAAVKEVGTAAADVTPHVEAMTDTTANTGSSGGVQRAELTVNHNEAFTGLPANANQDELRQIVKQEMAQYLQQHGDQFVSAMTASLARARRVGKSERRRRNGASRWYGASSAFASRRHRPIAPGPWAHRLPSCRAILAWNTSLGVFRRHGLFNRHEQSSVRPDWVRLRLEGQMNDRASPAAITLSK